MLGPTNTGKTHAALEAMLQHPDGMIGLPLRLLAREVYDRLCTRLGEQAVALCTGEERRIPPRARYWACTVESMPVSRPFSFVAIDEVQLAADPARGHVFTDRILHCRGTAETWFCGSATAALLLSRLVPELELRSRPRLSKLEHVGHVPLKSLPGRTAIVAYSAPRVVELAEKVRRKHGGAAVVFGALSPRTRNAQVAMFESGEVGHLVATDAIGMGLNLSVDLVVLAELEKFDGRAVRKLRADELAQVAGRAGRFERDGKFGTTEGAAPFPPDLADAVALGRLPDLRHLQWRPHDPDTRTLAGLAAALRTPSPHGALRRSEAAEDEATLAELIQKPEVRRRATTPDAVALLWEVCRVPDYRKVGPYAHAELLADVYARLCDHGRLSRRYVEGRLRPLERIDGEVEDLLDRVAAIRTWTYLAWRPGWVEDGEGLAQAALAVETLLSDTLHTRLAERFVDPKSRVGPGAGAVALGDDGAVRVAGATLGRVRGVSWVEGEPPAALVRALTPVVAERVEALVAGPADFVLDDELRVSWQGGPVARLVAGPAAHEPALKPTRNPLLAPGAAMRVSRKAEAWLRDWLAELFAPLRVPGASPGVRGVLYSLERELGTTLTAPLQPGAFGPGDRRQLAQLGVRFGVRYTWSEALAARTVERARLHAAAAGLARTPEVPTEAVAPRRESDAFYAAIGYVPVGPRALRVDVAERVAAGLRGLARTGDFKLPPELVAELGADVVEEIVEAYGYARAGERWRRRR